MCRFGRNTALLRDKSTLAPAEERTIHLKHVPSLPILGSTISQWSGVKFDYNNLLDLWPKLRKKFGDFYTVGLPGRGVGITQTVYVIQEPKEMMKVLRSEGKYPTSFVEKLWFIKQMQKDYNFGRPGNIFGYGEDWKLIRNFLQSDFLAPQSANQYLPGILNTVPYISKGMARHSDNLSEFLPMASFDMFCSILIGQFPRICDPDAVVDPADDEFCKKVTGFLKIGSLLTISPYETLLNKLGIRSETYKKLYDDWTLALDHGMKKLVELDKKKDTGTLTEFEEASYWNRAMERWEKGDTGLTKDEVSKVCLTLFNASVDTTSAKTSWHLLHVALNEEVQEKLYQEIYTNVQETGGKITPGLFAASKSPYLGAVLRESQRLTTPVNLAPMRRITKETEVHGTIIPAGNIVCFDQVSKGKDPEFVDDPFTFRPERFLPDAVEARKGTKSEFLDHPLFSGPFGQGARRCPGSRVARNEAIALVAQCVLDWKMSVPGISDYRDVPYSLETVMTPKLPKFNFEPRK